MDEHQSTKNTDAPETETRLDAIRRTLGASVDSFLSDRFYFPFYPTSESVHCGFAPKELAENADLTPEAIIELYGELSAFTDWRHLYSVEAIRSLFNDGWVVELDDSISLGEAAIMIGYRILGGPAYGVELAPSLFAEAIVRGDLIPRHPATRLSYRDNWGELPDLSWRIYPRELQALTEKLWGKDIYFPPTENQDAPARKDRGDLDMEPDPRHRRTLLRVIAALMKQAKIDREMSPNKVADIINSLLRELVLTEMKNDTIARVIQAAREID